MAKRKLTVQQRRRIAEQRQQKRESKNQEAIGLNEINLGELQQGLVIANHGRQAMVEATQNINAPPPESLAKMNDACPKRCHLRANLDIVTGDKVMWRPDLADGIGIIESRFDRTSELQRPDIYGKLRVVAANATQMIITLATAPEPHANLIDRYLVAATMQHLRPIVVINKSELIGTCSPSISEKIRNIVTLYRNQGIPVILVSAHSGEGMPELQQQLRDNSSIFVGQSGVGKSSLIQALLPNEEIRIGKLSEVSEKGRHTTTHSHLFHFDSGGHCIDSPGIREFGLWHANEYEVLSAFPDIRHYAEKCRFRDCKHHNEPGCDVLRAIKENDLDKTRFDSYTLILAQLNDVNIQTEH